jgi:N-acetylneuraminic acid mutarotase
MRRFFLIPVLFFAVLVTAEAGKLKNEIQGIWSVTKVETTEQNLNLLIKDYDFSKLLVEFTKSGTVWISGKDTGTKYSVTGNKIVLSEGMVKEIRRAEAKASIKSDSLTVNLPADLVKQIVLTVKDMYLKSGGEVFVAKMIENVVKTYSIEAVVILKRA